MYSLSRELTTMAASTALPYNHHPGSEDEPLLGNEHGRKKSSPCKTMGIFQAVTLVLCLAVLGILKKFAPRSYDSLKNSDSIPALDTVAPSQDFPFEKRCGGKPCFIESSVSVRKDRVGFPSFWNYAKDGPLEVTYDGRSLMINGDRALFLGGSMHPVRSTQRTWGRALDEAVHNGLNMITIYVFWSAHQAFPGEEYDWNFPQGIDCSDSSSCDWSLGTAIREAANRGLFLHLRIGPYDCAEYNYGAIPEWLNIHSPNMTLRRPNLEWYDAMEGYVNETINYITDAGLWAYQGGPILMGQIENELGGEMDETENIISFDEQGQIVDPNQGLRKATLQDYADWCGDLVERLAPDIVWTMCNGLSAENTINTCNGISECTNWLERHGGDGRVQVDRPAILTEFEGGFQVWGETPEKPSDYFWGRTARDMSRDALKWFARGGTHLNYYMWYGGYNRGRMAGAGITNIYASDTIMCASGQRHQPKFNHVQKLHHLLADIAPTLLNTPTALDKGKKVEHLDANNQWVVGKDQRMFEYTPESSDSKHIMFLENDGKHDVVVRLPKADAVGPKDFDELQMSATSCVVLVDGAIRFDSSVIDHQDERFTRKMSRSPDIPALLDWSDWFEPIGVGDKGNATSASIPIEQTMLNNDNKVSSDYAWYETEIYLEETVCNSKLLIETQKSNGFLVFIDHKFVGSAASYQKAEGDITLQVDSGCISRGPHKLSLLSESFGYFNLIGRWGGSTKTKTKGITGDVILSTAGTNSSLVDGREWRSKPGLHGEEIGSIERTGLRRHLNAYPGSSTSPQWSSALFDTPSYNPSNQALFLDIRMGRGHLWLNGRDLGRYWNITRGDTDQLSQQYYLLPDDYLHSDGTLNELILFDAFGSDKKDVDLVVSWIDPSDDSEFLDEVDYPLACI